MILCFLENFVKSTVSFKFCFMKDLFILNFNDMGYWQRMEEPGWFLCTDSLILCVLFRLQTTPWVGKAFKIWPSSYPQRMTRYFKPGPPTSWTWKLWREPQWRIVVKLQEPQLRNKLTWSQRLTYIFGVNEFYLFKCQTWNDRQQIQQEKSQNKNLILR